MKRGFVVVYSTVKSCLLDKKRTGRTWTLVKARIALAITQSMFGCVYARSIGQRYSLVAGDKRVKTLDLAIGIGKSVIFLIEWWALIELRTES